MPNRYTRTMLSLGLVLSVLTGHINDLTTGQPLVGVTVTADGPSHRHAITDRNGRYSISGLKAGSYTLSMESNDVPPQNATVKVGVSQKRVFDLKLCSTTLDYHCVPAGGDGGGGG